MTQPNTTSYTISNEPYQQIHKVMPIPCVDIVLVKDGQFLLAKRQNKPAQGQWWLPGGRVLKGETLEGAVARKMKQETGLKVSIKKMLGTDVTMFPDGPFDGPTHTINTVFLASPYETGSVISLDIQNKEYQWFYHINNDWHPYVKKFLEMAGFEMGN